MSIYLYGNNSIQKSLDSTTWTSYNLPVDSFDNSKYNQDTMI